MASESKLILNNPALFVKEICPAHIVLDCDGTLYPNISKARADFMAHMLPFISKWFDLPLSEAANKLHALMESHHTESEIAACLLTGIPEEILNREVIDKMNIEDLLDERTRPWSSLSEIDVPITVLTNNSSYFANRIVKKLNLPIKEIIGESEAGFVRKPDIEIYKIAQNTSTGESKPVLYFDDNLSSINSAASLGWVGVLTAYKSTLIHSSQEETDVPTLLL